MGTRALIASNLGGSSHDLLCFSQYFGGVNRILAGHGQMRQIAGGFMNGSVARGAQVLGFKVHLNLHLSLSLSCIPPGDREFVAEISGDYAVMEWAAAGTSGS